MVVSTTPEVGMETCKVFDFNNSGKVAQSMHILSLALLEVQLGKIFKRKHNLREFQYDFITEHKIMVLTLLLIK